MIKLPSAEFYQLQLSGHRDKTRPSISRRAHHYFCGSTAPLNVLYLEEHGAVPVRVGRLDVVRSAGVSAAQGAHDDTLPGLPLQAPCEAAAACTELLGLLEAGVLQDAFWERSS